MESTGIADAVATIFIPLTPFINAPSAQSNSPSVARTFGQYDVMQTPCLRRENVAWSAQQRGSNRKIRRAGI